MTDSVGVYELSRGLRGRIDAAAGGGPLLVTRYDRPVAFLCSLEVGLPATPEAGAAAEVGIARLAMTLSAVLQTVEEQGRAVMITRHRRGLAMLVPAVGPLMEEYRRSRQRHLDEMLLELRQHGGPAALTDSAGAEGSV